MKEKIEQVRKGFSEDSKGIDDLNSLENLRIKYFSRNGIFAQLFEEFRTLPKDEKPKYGKVLNEEKKSAQSIFNGIKSKIESSNENQKDFIDLTLPGREKEIGVPHVLTQTLNEIKSI